MQYFAFIYLIEETKDFKFSSVELGSHFVPFSEKDTCTTHNSILVDEKKDTNF